MAACVLILSAAISVGRPIEAVKGKQYKITKAHGPWMIMVASFRDVPKTRIDYGGGQARLVRNEMYSPGMTAREAADQLVYELRRHGIPAYAFSQSEVTDEVTTRDRLGRTRSRSYLAQQGSVCVLAGNYSGPEDRTAQRTLELIKKFHPRFLRAVEEKVETRDGGLMQRLRNGGIFRSTPGRPGPLAGAFLTINPLLTPEEANRRRRDPLLLTINSGGEYSLLDNPGRYTLVVATSYVKSTTTTNAARFDKALKDFQISDHLDESALSAWQLAKTLRLGRVPFRDEKLGIGRRRFEAYVFHDRHRSIVTVGSFNSPQEPRIAELKKIFGAKIRTNPNTGKDVLVAEVVTLPDPDDPRAPLKTWIFDPKPRLIEVPRLR